MQIHACLLALHTGRPVKMVYSREESFFGHVHRHPATLYYEHGITPEGRLVSIRARVYLDGGAYMSSSPAVVANAATLGAGPYEVPNVAIDVYAAYTNNPPCGAMRGFGAVQAAFAYESQMDETGQKTLMTYHAYAWKNKSRKERTFFDYVKHLAHLHKDLISVRIRA